MKHEVILPLVLIFVGVSILIGCIPIPATRQLQPDGKPRPERAIGSAPDKPVRLGHTTIGDAFVELSRRVTSRQTGWIYSAKSTTTPQWSILNWNVAPDGRRFAFLYT